MGLWSPANADVDIHMELRSGHDSMSGELTTLRIPGLKIQKSSDYENSLKNCTLYQVWNCGDGHHDGYQL